VSVGRGRLIVTPEHVQIRLEPAGLGNRFIALAVDLAIAGAVAATLAQLTLALLPGAVATMVNAVAFLLVSWGYHVFFEVRQQGQSPGKRLMGLRVVDGRGLPISFEQSVVRNVVRALDVAPVGYAVGAIVCLFDRERRRLGDVAADTLVVRETGAFEFDRRSAGDRVFNSLRTPRVLRLIGHKVSLEEREFLATLCLRADGLEPKRRFDLMEEVGRHYRERLQIDDPHLSGENLVRGLTAILFAERSAAGTTGRGALAGHGASVVDSPRHR
jgi:uncharacterized RDD family membrane protein YckC